MRKISLFLITGLLFIACKKESTEIYTQSAQDASLAEQLSIDVLKEVLLITPDYVINQAYTGNLGIIVSSVPEITDPTYPKTITINYGTGTTGQIGKVRSGNLIVTINSGTVITEDLEVSFDNFKSDGSQILGDITYSYNSTNTGYDGTLLNDGISVINANGTMKWNGAFSLNRSSTSGTVNVDDDLYSFSCSTTGVDFDQTSFTYNSTTDHEISFGCKEFILSGKSALSPNGKDAQTIDFGSGDCDATGSISLADGTSKNFTF